jgi:hypothetical protein
MSISSLRTGAIGISAALDNNYMEPIASTLVGAGGTNSITFSDIPQTYKHLQVRATVLGTGSISWQPMTFNGDTGNNYTNHGITANGSTVSAFGEANHGFISHQAAISTNPFVMVMDILDYANTNKYKTVRTLGGYDANGSGILTFRSGLWMNTNAITTIKIQPNANNYSQYSRFSLYGIRG